MYLMVQPLGLDDIIVDNLDIDASLVCRRKVLEEFR